MELLQGPLEMGFIAGHSRRRVCVWGDRGRVKAAAIHTSRKSNIAPIWLRILFAKELDEVGDWDVGSLQDFGEQEALWQEIS